MEHLSASLLIVDSSVKHMQSTQNFRDARSRMERSAFSLLPGLPIVAFLLASECSP